MAAPWMPDWAALMKHALPIDLPPGDGYLYLIADSHLGDRRAPPGEFVAMLRGLERPRAVVFLGDLFTVWLAPPKYREPVAQEVLAGFQSLRDRGAYTVFVVGNREFFLPRSAAEAQRWGLPFDAIVPGAAVLTWAGRRYGLTHGDLASRHDLPYLKWRWLARSWPFEAAFRAMPAGLARRIARRLERSLATTNREIKIQYPAEDLQAFAQAVVPGLDGFFIGHFHRDEVIVVPGQTAALRIVPDWHARKVVLRVEVGGEVKYVGGTTALEPPMNTDGHR
jgi:UDP-2,3-diacylglucosamine hydrolase